jgi:hypothetical protein
MEARVGIERPSFSSATTPRPHKSLTDNQIPNFPKHIQEISLKQVKFSESNYYPATIRLLASHYPITGAFTGGAVVGDVLTFL